MKGKGHQGRKGPRWRFRKTTFLQQLRGKQWFNLIVFFLAVYFFIIGIKLMGSGFKDMGRGFSSELIEATAYPLVGLCIGIFTTALIQSSSATTATVVTLVIAEPRFYPMAIPIVIGANIGTSVTNVIVSMGHITHRASFRRAFAGALVHDFFNIIAASLIFPIEWIVKILTGKGILERLGLWTAELLVGKEGFEFDFMDILLGPILDPVKDGISSIGVYPAIVKLVVGIIILFLMLLLITKSARRAIEGKVQKVVDRVLFKNAPTSFGFGAILTSFVQSSSVTTSLVVPLVGAGILSIEQIFPYTLGANIGTTITAILAAMAVMSATEGAKWALAISLVHLYFNIFGIILVYPFRKAPITLAKMVARYISGHRQWAILFVLLVFFAIPGSVILLDRFIF